MNANKLELRDTAEQLANLWRSVHSLPTRSDRDAAFQQLAAFQKKLASFIECATFSSGAAVKQKTAQPG